jgi:hypothetical protein
MRHMVRLRRFALPRRIFSPAQPFVNDQADIASGGSPHLSAIRWQTLAISVRTARAGSIMRSA